MELKESSAAGCQKFVGSTGCRLGEKLAKGAGKQVHGDC